MKFKNICIVVLAVTVASCTTPPSGYDGVYEGKELDHIAFPLGGLGAGMICVEGTGALSNVSLFHEPDLFNEPATFSAICVKGYENGAKVLEGQVPDYKIFGRGQGGTRLRPYNLGYAPLRKLQVYRTFPVRGN